MLGAMWYRFGFTNETIFSFLLLPIVCFTGRQVQLRHIRGDKELPPLVDDANYDVHYQEYRQFQRPVNVLPVRRRT